MRVVKTAKALRPIIDLYKRKNKRIGFVPTMGALHDGHLSLLRRCHRENDISVLSIFVNPTQFGPQEDYHRYPGKEKKDKLLAKKEKADIIFYPSAEEIYSRSFKTFIEVNNLGKILCGKSRPTHFKGVTTVVGKLLNIIDPHVLYLGQKDYQQAVIIKRMVADLNFLCTIRICPTVREKDGLALSSRNQYLSQKQREEATHLYRSLKRAKKEIMSGQLNIKTIIQHIRAHILKSTSGRIDYVACVDALTLNPLRKAKGNICIALAVNFDKARLIDNIIFKR